MVVGRQAGQHVEEENTKIVDVDGVTVLAAEEYLRREKGYGAAERGGALRTHALLRQAEVRQHGVELLVQHDIVGLQVAEHRLPLVKVAERQEDLRGVQPGDGLLQPTLPGDQLLQAAVRAKLQHEDEVARGLEGVLEPHDVRVPGVCEDVAFRHRVALQVPAHDLALLQHLHSIDLASPLVLHLVDLAEGAAAHEPHEFKGIGANTLHRGARVLPQTHKGRPMPRRGPRRGHAE
mmetsp:Transcript_43291/g.125142  ORF Transcript_43291/g.125142 Transcript_43291/m.125142 type:complete len:235 (-) Transcript_43291:578-1282(-)